MARNLNPPLIESAAVPASLRLMIEPIADEAHNLIFIGGTGTVKTPLATAIESRLGKKGRFFSVVDLVNKLEQEKLSGRSGSLSRRLASCENDHRMTEPIDPSLRHY